MIPRERKFLALILFSISFALVEAILVIYLRKTFGIDSGLIPADYTVLLNLWAITFLTPNSKILPDNHFTQIEIFRELATMVMILAVAYLAGKNIKQKVGSYLIIFSIWDLFYYFFLKIIAGWPKTIWNIDVFFLFPFPWVGPVITPIFLFILLLFLGITLYIQGDKTG